MIFKLRPHHVICNLCFQGKGYDAKFIENFSLIHNSLLAAPEAKSIQITNGVDDICQQCPKNINNKCEGEPSPANRDHACSTALRYD